MRWARVHPGWAIVVVAVVAGAGRHTPDVPRNALDRASGVYIAEPQSDAAPARLRAGRNTVRLATGTGPRRFAVRSVLARCPVRLAIRSAGVPTVRVRAAGAWRPVQIAPARSRSVTITVTRAAGARPRGCPTLALLRHVPPPPPVAGPLAPGPAVDGLINPSPSAGEAFLVSSTVPSARRIVLGTAVAWDPFVGGPPVYATTVREKFRSVTPENAMKMDTVAPAEGVFDFSKADAIVDAARINGQAVRGHTLVWHNQIASWVAARRWDRAALRAFLEHYVRTVVGHFRGRVDSWDVVNEPLNPDGSLRSSLWSDVLGPGYIADALRWAHEADPGATLFINDFGTERRGPKADGMLRLADGLLAQGAPLMSIGFQTHVKTTYYPTAAELAGNLARFAAIGLGVEITELDVETSETPGSPGDRDRAQAGAYAAIGAACRATPACNRLTVWGFTDASTWLGTAERPLPFDDQYRPKPAWTALLDAVN